MIETFSRTFDLEDIEIQRGGDGRTVTAYAAVFGQDAEIRDVHGHYIERIDAKAFNRTLTMGPVSRIGVLYNHGYDTSGRPNMVGSVPIGTPLEIKADHKGLLTVTRYNKSELASHVLEAIRDGQIRGQSFRGRIVASKDVARGRVKTILRTELGLSEYGPTFSPAYEGAGILAIRSADPETLELLRGMIRAELATSTETDQQKATSHGEPGAGDPPDGHSLRLKAKRNAMAMRARQLGIHRGEAPQEH